MPKFYEWQDVKDEIRVYAPHLTVHKYEGDEAIGIWEVNIRSNRAAHNAYSAFPLPPAELLSANNALQLL